MPAGCSQAWAPTSSSSSLRKARRPGDRAFPRGCRRRRRASISGTTILGKRSIVVDLDKPDGQESFLRLASAADIVLDARPRGYLADRNLAFERLRSANPATDLSADQPVLGIPARGPISKAAISFIWRWAAS